MYRGPPRGPCIGSIYPTLLGFGGIQAIILSYMVSLATRRRRGRGGGARGTPDPTPAPTPAPGPGGTPWPSFSAPWPGRIPMWPFQGQGDPSSSAPAGGHARRCCSPVHAVLDPARSAQPAADLAWGVGPGRTGVVLQRHGADAASLR